MMTRDMFVAWVLVTMACSTSPSMAKPSMLRSKDQRTLVVGNDDLGKIVNRTDLPETPTSRYIEWADWTADDQKELMDVLGYTESTWNIPGTADIELLSFYTINLTSLGYEEDEDGALVLVGRQDLDDESTPIDVIMDTLDILDEDVWDCHINHYEDYFWEELEYYNLSLYFEELGWDEDKWLGLDDSYPATEEMQWWELNETQRLAAMNLCYKLETWAMLPLPLWSFNETIQNATAAGDEATDVQPENRPNIQPWDLPIVRFTLWSELTAEQQGHAAALGFNETTWNTPGTAEIEYEYFYYAELNSSQTAALDGLGINEFFFDCLFQHYGNYDWVELEGLPDTMELWATLGWTFGSWHRLQPPPQTEATPWTLLTGAEKEAATQLCYIPETWYDPTKPEGYHLSEINKEQFVPPAAPVRRSDGPFL